jgi:hypothetical protein
MTSDPQPPFVCTYAQATAVILNSALLGSRTALGQLGAKQGRLLLLVVCPHMYCTIYVAAVPGHKQS